MSRFDLDILFVRELVYGGLTDDLQPGKGIHTGQGKLTRLSCSFFRGVINNIIKWVISGRPYKDQTKQSVREVENPML